MAAKRSQRKRRVQGNVAILVALMLPMIMAFVAFAVDMGNVYRVRTQDQSAVDSAALAGAAMLDGSNANGEYSLATSTAQAYGNAHYAYTSNLNVQTSDVTLGHWTQATSTTPGSFQPDDGSMSSLLVNAVKVDYQIPNNVTTPFASIVGTGSLPVRTSAIALGGGPPLNKCVFPLAIADCAIRQAISDGTCSMCIQMTTATDDNAAWFVPGQSPGNGQQDFRDAILGACFDEAGLPSVDENGVCTGGGDTCEESQMGTDEQLNGGALMNTSNQGFCTLIEQLLTRNAPDTPVDPFTVTVGVIDTEIAGSDCGGATLAGHGSMAGYVDADIFGVRCGNAQSGYPAYVTTPPNGSDATACSDNAYQNEFLLASLHQDPDTGTCSHKPKDIYSSGTFTGTPARPRLVQ